MKILIFFPRLTLSDKPLKAVLLILMGLLLQTPAASAQSVCDVQAKTDLERLYCKIQKTRYGRSLPSFADFQKNNPTVQTALLKGPARKLGMKLPTISPSRQSAQARQATPSTPARTAKPELKAKSTSKPVAVSLTEAALAPEKPVAYKTITLKVPSLIQCNMEAQRILCPEARFTLQSNKSNRTLNQTALSDRNRLQVPAFTGSANNQQALNSYLADAYQTYIEKLLSIGLGASTMSYTKFHYTFLDLQEKNEPFHERLAAMFEYLKKDKANMAIKSRYSDKLPSSIEQCSRLSSEIIVCDDRTTNWVFTASP